MTYQFIRWDFDANEATEFQREGDCNGCGACCKTLIRFTRLLNRDSLSLAPDVDTATLKLDSDPDPGEGGDCTGTTGVWNEVVREDGERRFYRFAEIGPVNGDPPCPELGEGNRCQVQDTKNLLCRSWPHAPEQVTPFAECSYSFVELARWPIEPAPLAESEAIR